MFQSVLHTLISRDLSSNRDRNVHMKPVAPTEVNLSFIFEIEIQNSKSEVIFGVFQSPEVREKFSKTNQISILDFQCVAINIEG
jgi:hypothetical protein